MERATLWERTGVAAEFRKTHQWSAPGLPIPVDRVDDADLPWVNARLVGNDIVHLDQLGDLPADVPDLPALHAMGVRSLLAMPISSSGMVIGALSVTTLSDERRWSEALFSGLGLLAEAFASLIARRTAEQARSRAESEAAQWRERLSHLVRVHTVGEMSTALAHEITQPLGAIENYALAARRRAQGAAPDMVKIADLLDKIAAQAIRAGDVVSHLRGMVRRHDLEMRPVDIERAVSGCIDLICTDCAMRDIHVAFTAEGRLPLVQADEIHVQQVVLNLLRNAIDAIERCEAGAPREITVSIRAADGDGDGGGVTVQVADVGPGIAEDDLERVFESFYSTKADGLGVGLAISRKLIEAHGGTLWAEHRPGGGALFQFTLPANGE